MVLSRPSVKSSSCFWSASIGLSFSFSLSLPFEWGEGRAFFPIHFSPILHFKTTSVSFNDMKRLFASAARRVGSRAALSLDGFAVVERGRRGGGDAKKESFLLSSRHAMMMMMMMMTKKKMEDALKEGTKHRRRRRAETKTRRRRTRRRKNSTRYSRAENAACDRRKGLANARITLAWL